MLVALPRIALACPVCFGDSDAPMAVAAKMGVVFMLGVVVAVLAAFAAFFVYLMRRAKQAAIDVPNPADAGRYLDGREGTAQC
jgi:hypothetical protein